MLNLPGAAGKILGRSDSTSHLVFFCKTDEAQKVMRTVVFPILYVCRAEPLSTNIVIFFEWIICAVASGPCVPCVLW